MTGGSLTWGVRQSIRNYLENFGHTEGWIAADGGATYAKGDDGAVFPAAGGTVDPAAGTASLAFDGSLEMFGFGEDWLYFEDVRIEIDGSEAEVVVDLIESYNVKEPVEDFVLATYPIGEGDLVIEDDALELTTEEGAFTEAAWRDHLPSYGGPTYGPPTDFTDPLVLSLSFGDGGSDEPGDDEEQPGDDDGDGADDDGAGEADGPYGTSTGSPLTGTTAYMTVTPGYALDADGATTVTVEGFGYDPGPEAAPGTGSGGIYVGLGTMKNPGTEEWRRSNGGSSGPVGQADYTYGVPRFVGNQNSADADVADAVMDSEGHWSFDIEIPASEIPSFFGDTIDCVENGCGFFSFGAHGSVNAANEAFTPVFFLGQDDSDWPDPGGDDATPVPPVTPDKPTGAPSALPAQSSLTAANRGDVDVVSVSGGEATVFAGAGAVNTWVASVAYSDPQFVDWHLVPANGRIRVDLPGGLDAGDHRLALLSADEELVGWDSFTLSAASGGGADADKGEPYGSSTGENPYTGATMTVTPAWSLADSGQVVNLTGTGYATDLDGSNEGGAYVLFGWIDPEAGDDWGPGPDDRKESLGQSGITYTYAPDGEVAGTFQTMVNYPGNTTGPGLPFIQEDGSWEIEEFPIQSSRFESVHGTQIDCYVQQCGVLTIGAHGKANSGVEVFTPVYFTDERPSNEPPANAGGDTGIVSNPNMTGGAGDGASDAATAGSGLSAATGQDGLAPAAEGRTLIIAGILLVSLGAFIGAARIARTRRLVAAPIRPVP